MDKRLGFAMVLSASALAWVGCDEPPPPDGGVCGGDSGIICIDEDAGDGEDAGPGEDAGHDDEDGGGGGGACDFSVPGRGVGSACSRNSCVSPDLMCQQENSIGGPNAIDSVNLDGTAGPPLEGVLFPNGGECTSQCALDDTSDPCGECADCQGIRLGNVGLIVGADAAGNALGICRPNCTPSTTDNGGCRAGYTCDINSGTCVEACTDDMQCRFGIRDPDGNGEGDITYLGDSFPATCSTETGRCNIAGTAGAVPGDPCTEDSDCEDNGLCLTGDGWPGGYCSRLGCNWEGFECAEGAICDVRSFGDVSACLVGCQVGAEAEADRLGAGGHGDTCAPGFTCMWSGVEGPDASPNGGCIPGEYNEVTTPNVGVACESDADCYSPFGYGRCLFSNVNDVDSGYCAVSNCIGGDPNGILPGVSTTTRVCDEGAGELCVNFGSAETPTTFCVPGCDTADECAPGFACAHLLGGGGGLCYPNCFQAADCRDGVMCESVVSGGECDADGPDDIFGNADDQPDDCYCADRMPRMDGGVDVDAGVVDAGLTDGGVDGGV